MNEEEGIKKEVGAGKDVIITNERSEENETEMKDSGSGTDSVTENDREIDRLNAIRMEDEHEVEDGTKERINQRIKESIKECERLDDATGVPHRCDEYWAEEGEGLHYIDIDPRSHLEVADQPKHRCVPCIVYYP